MSTQGNIQQVHHQLICLPSTLKPKHIGPQTDWRLVALGLWAMSTNEMHVQEGFRVIRSRWHFWTSLMA